MGTRKKYVNVLNYIALAVTVSGLQLYILFKFFPDAMQLPDYMTNNNPMGEGLVNATFEYNSFWFIALIPLYALISKLAFKNIEKIQLCSSYRDYGLYTGTFIDYFFHSDSYFINDWF
jgi:hypothetical protein